MYALAFALGGGADIAHGPENLDRVCLGRLGDGDEFYDVEAPLPRLDLGDIRLRHAKCAGHVGLLETGVQSRFHKQFAKLFVCGGEFGFRHGSRCVRVNTQRLLARLGYPKLGYSICFRPKASPTMSQDEVRHCAAQVQSYLCADPAMFATVEYLLEFGGKGGKGDRIFDLLAWDARAERLFVVEVTTNKSLPKGLVERVKLDWARRDALKAALEGKGVKVGRGGLWWWIFVREQFLDAFAEALPPEMKPFVRLTGLQRTFFYPDYKDARRIGGEPSKI